MSAKAIAMRIGVGENPSLEHLVREKPTPGITFDGE